MRFVTIFLRSCRLRCPRCGLGKLFRGWFAMNPCCPACDYKFERAPGYFLGSIYFNYGLTALLLLVTFMPLHWSGRYSSQTLRVLGVAFSILFPLWFFRYARSLWVGFDQYFDPVEEQDEPAAEPDEPWNDQPDESWRESL